MTLPDPRDDKWGGPDIRISEYGLWDNEDDDGDPDVPGTPDNRQLFPGKEGTP